MLKFYEFLQEAMDSGAFLQEAIDPADYLERQNKEASLFVGRLQPIHNGHAAIIKMMKKNPYVAVVKGKISGQDKSRNPFDFKYQQKLIKMVDSKAKVIQVPTGYIPDIINEMRKKGFETTVMLAGDDRISGYKKQIEGFNKQMPEEKQINLKFVKTPRVTSASLVRDLIKADDEKGFKKEVPKQLWGEYSKMRKMMPG